ncbi:MAG: hypothetical protein HP498_05805 [Nitrospira sp.]|nr:hypothetical protein [Nitrospira sp.]
MPSHSRTGNIAVLAGRAQVRPTASPAPKGGEACGGEPAMDRVPGRRQRGYFFLPSACCSKLFHSSRFTAGIVVI